MDVTIVGDDPTQLGLALGLRTGAFRKPQNFQHSEGP